MYRSPVVRVYNKLHITALYVWIHPMGGWGGVMFMNDT